MEVMCCSFYHSTRDGRQRPCFISSLSLFVDEWISSLSPSLSSMETKDIYCVSNIYTFWILFPLAILVKIPLKRKKNVSCCEIWGRPLEVVLHQICNILFYTRFMTSCSEYCRFFAIYGLSWRHINQPNCSANYIFIDKKTIIHFVKDISNFSIQNLLMSRDVFGKIIW